MKPSRPYHSFTAYHREPGGLRRLDFFVDRVEAWRQQRPRPSVRILDIGCGNGNISLAFGGLGYTVTGVDLDGPSIAQARRSAEDLRLVTTEFIEGSVDALHGQTFDVIIASEVLEHQKKPAEFLANLAQLLKPGGTLLLSVPNGKSLEERIRKFTTHTSVGLSLKRRLKNLIRHQGIQSASAHPHEQFFSWGEVSSLLRTHGWRVREASPGGAFFRGFFYLCGRLFIRRGSGVFHVLDVLDNVFAPATPFFIADGWLLEARPFNPTRQLVMHILPTLESGGAERFVFDIAKRLPAKGFDVHVVSILRGGPLEPLFATAGVPLTVLGVRGLFGFSAMRALYRLMKRERPDVVHTHLFGADVWGRIAARCAGVRVIISTEHNVNTEHGMVKRLVKGMMSGITDRFIAPTHVVKKNMVEREYIPVRKISVVPNGIDLSRVIVRPARGFHDVPRLITVGRLVPQKSHATLLKALALVKEPWVLEIIGAGPLEAELHALAERLGIESRIRWTGFSDAVPHRLAESDLFIFPSRWEGFGLALLEAVVAGVPCIVSDLPVFHEVVSSKEVTFVPVGEVPAFAHAIREVLQHPFPAIERASTAAEHVRASASIDSTVTAYAKVYTECAK